MNRNAGFKLNGTDGCTVCASCEIAAFLRRFPDTFLFAFRLTGFGVFVFAFGLVFASAYEDFEFFFIFKYLSFQSELV